MLKEQHADLRGSWRLYNAVFYMSGDLRNQRLRPASRRNRYIFWVQGHLSPHNCSLKTIKYTHTTNSQQVHEDSCFQK